jgi:voltage-gated potassium channel
MSSWQRWLRLAGACTLAVFMYFVVPVSTRQPTDAIVLRGLASVASLGLLAFLIVWQLRLALEHGLDRRLDGLVISLVIVVMAFALGFYVVSVRDPAQLEGISTRVDALYFTLSTMTTVGYGDVHAAGQAARVMVLTQMAFNLVFVATAAAVLGAHIRATASKRLEEKAVAHKPEQRNRQ